VAVAGSAGVIGSPADLVLVAIVGCLGCALCIGCTGAWVASPAWAAGDCIGCVRLRVNCTGLRRVVGARDQHVDRRPGSPPDRLSGAVGLTESATHPLTNPRLAGKGGGRLADGRGAGGGDRFGYG